MDTYPLMVTASPTGRGASAAALHPALHPGVSATVPRRIESAEPEGVSDPAGHEHTSDLSAEELIGWAANRFGPDVCLSSSFGADSAVMLHMATRIIPDIVVILVDTGYLFPETYRFAEELRQKLGFRLHVVQPAMSAAHQEALYGQLWEQGDEGVRRYLELNKVEPLKRALRELGVRAWMSGVRAQQTEHRRGLPRVVVQDGSVKIHPILHFTRAQVDDYLKKYDLPKHPLVAQGYKSIGDWHSTIPVLDGQDERSGRLLGSKKECGLHLTDGERASFDAARL